MTSLFQTIGVNQLQRAGYGGDYPFTATIAAVQYLLGDLWLSYPDDTCDYTLPLAVSQLTGLNGADGDKDLIIVDALGAVVFDTTTSTVRLATPWGASLITLTWSAGETVLRATMRTVPPPWLPDLTWAADITLDPPGVLDARTYERLPRRVRSLIIGDTTITAADVVLTAGYNMSLTQDDPAAVDGGRLIHRIVMDASPGGGLGTVPGCTKNTGYIYRINAVSPTPTGEFIIQANNCYRVQRPVQVVSTDPRTVTPYVPDLEFPYSYAALQFFNDCGPCCTCQQFLQVYEGERRLSARIAAAGAQAESIRDQYDANAARWTSQAACRASQALRLVLNAEPAGVLYVAGLDCNRTPCCAVPLVLRTTFEYLVAGEEHSWFDLPQRLLCRESKRAGSDTNYEEVAYTPADFLPILDTYFDFADPQAISRFRNRIQFPDAGDADTVRVTLSLHMPNTYNAATGQECLLPDPSTIDVPAPVAALWAAQPPPYPVRALIQQVSPVSQTAGCCGQTK